MTFIPFFVHFTHCSASCLNRPSGQFSIPSIICPFYQLKKIDKKNPSCIYLRALLKELSRCKVKLSQGIWACLSVLDLTVWICSLNICCLNMPFYRCRALILNQLPHFPVRGCHLQSGWWKDWVIDGSPFRACQLHSQSRHWKMQGWCQAMGLREGESVPLPKTEIMRILWSVSYCSLSRTQ